MAEGKGGNLDSSSEKIHGHIVKKASIMAIFTFISRITGLIREQARGYFLGTGTGSDAFGLAATFPNLFRRLFAEGAMTSAVIPVIADFKDDKKKLWEFFGAFISIFTTIVVAVTVISILLTPWLINTFFATEFSKIPGKVELTIILTKLMFPYLVFISLAAMVQALLNSFGIFGPSAFTPILLNATIVVTAFLFSKSFDDPSYSFALGFVVGGIVQLAFQIPFLKKCGFLFKSSFNFKHEGVRRVFKLFLPGVFSAGIYQINVFVSQIIASRLPEGSIASLQFSIRLQELVLGIFVISVTTVILPSLSSFITKNRKKEAEESLFFSARILLFITVPASILLLLLRKPVIHLLFQHGSFNEHSTSLTAYALLFHSFGIPFIALSRTYNQIYYANKDMILPTIFGAVSMIVNIGLCLVLSPYLKHGGIALAGSVSAFTTFILLIIFLKNHNINVFYKKLFTTFLKTVVISIPSAIVIIYAYKSYYTPSITFLNLILFLFFTILSYVIVFLIISYLFKIKEFFEILAIFSKKHSI